MNTKIGVNQEFLEKSGFILARIVSDEFVLYIKTKNAHWNIEGSDFYNKHIFFDELAEQLEDAIDQVAERIRSIGLSAPGTMKMFLQLTGLSESSRESNDSLGYMQELLADHESIIIHLRENINRIDMEFNDAGTSDFITALMEKHEKIAWMLRAHLK